MGKRACTVSLLSGVLTIVALGSALGSVAGYALTGLALGLLSDLSEWVTYSTEYSNWASSVTAVDSSQLVMATAGPLIAVLCGMFIALLALVISLVQIRGNLRAEPLKLLSTRDS